MEGDREDPSSDFLNRPCCISLQKGEERHRIPCSEVERWTGARFTPYLDFAEPKILRSIEAKIAQLHRSGRLSREALWFGRYFQRELETHPLPEVELRWIDGHVGWGIFALRPFKKMEFIAEYSGKVRKRRRSDRFNSYCFEYLFAHGIPSTYLIDAEEQGGIGRYLNHSAAPNLRSALAILENVAHVILVVDRPIAKGEQLLYDYGSAYWSQRAVPKALG